MKVSLGFGIAFIAQSGEKPRSEENRTNCLAQDRAKSLSICCDESEVGKLAGRNEDGHEKGFFLYIKNDHQRFYNSFVK